MESTRALTTSEVDPLIFELGDQLEPLVLVSFLELTWRRAARTLQWGNSFQAVSF